MVWKGVGRDPPRGVVVAQYRPPEGESPASMRYLERMEYDNRCFVAAVLSLAVKGYLSIEQEGGGLLRKGKYTLRRTQGSTTPLMPDEDALLRTVFANGDWLLLDDQNHAILQRAQKAHERELRQKYLKTFFRINGGWGFLGGVFGPAGDSAGHRHACGPWRLWHRVVPRDTGWLGDRCRRAHRPGGHRPVWQTAQKPLRARAASAWTKSKGFGCISTSRRVTS